MSDTQSRIHSDCPFCGQKVAYLQSQIGLKAKCPRCDNAVTLSPNGIILPCPVIPGTQASEAVGQPDGASHGSVETTAPTPRTATECYSTGLEVRLSSYEFEKLVAEFLRRRGLDVELTRPTADGGIDIKARSQDPILRGLIIIQCKKYAKDKKVGEPAIRDLYGVVASERASKGILITTSDFTHAALRFAAGKQLDLINGEEFEELLSSHFGDKGPSNVGVWQRTRVARERFSRLVELAREIDCYLADSQHGVYRKRSISGDAFMRLVHFEGNNLLVAISRFQTADAEMRSPRFNWSSSHILDNTLKILADAASQMLQSTQNVEEVFVPPEYVGVYQRGVFLFKRVLWDASQFTQYRYRLLFYPGVNVSQVFVRGPLFGPYPDLFDAYNVEYTRIVTIR